MSAVYWLSYDKFVQLEKQGLDNLIQRIQIFQKASELKHLPPIAKTEIIDGKHVEIWFGKIEDHLFVLEVCAKRGEQIECWILTPFRQRIEETNWHVMAQICSSTKLFRGGHVRFIESRPGPKLFGVYAVDPRGFDACVYEATSRSEALALTKFLCTSDFSGNYFVGESEQESSWKIIAHGASTNILGNYSSAASAFELAIQISQKTPDVLHIVKHKQGEDYLAAIVENGMISNSGKSKGSTLI